MTVSNVQNDSGLFELNFKDERYLPFEGCSAISEWNLELPKEARQFDYNSISDIVIHIKYTAREGGSSLKSLANTSLKNSLALIKQQLGEEGLHTAINFKHDLSQEWHMLKKNHTADLKIDKSRFPYMAQALNAKIENVTFVAKVKNNPATFTVTVDGSVTNFGRMDEWMLCYGTISTIRLDEVFTLAISLPQLNNLEELIMVVKYVL